MSKTDRKAAVADISEILCDAYLARLEEWLAGETTPHEFLEALLMLGEEPEIERFFCPRCTEKLMRLHKSN
jgi:hypothetical protein